MAGVDLQSCGCRLLVLQEGMAEVDQHHVATLFVLLVSQQQILRLQA